MTNDKKFKQERSGSKKFTGISMMIAFSVAYTVFIVTYFYLILRDFTICLIIAGVVYPYAIVSFKKYIVSQRIKKIEIQFGEALRFISASLSAGATIENSFYDFVTKTENYSKKDLSLIVKEFRKITNSMDMHESFSVAFDKFAAESGSSEIKIFSLALKQVCVSGGDIVSLVRNTAASLRIKRETEDEIDLVLAGPKYNHRVITVMPVFIIFLMRFISPEYVETMYNGAGKIVAVISAVLIVIAYIIGSRLSDIRF